MTTPDNTADEDTVEFSVDIPVSDDTTADDVAQACADLGALRRKHFEQRGTQPPDKAEARQEFLAYISPNVLAPCDAEVADVIRARVSAPAPPEFATVAPPAAGDYRVLVQPPGGRRGEWVTIEVHEARRCASVEEAVARFLAARQRS